MLYYHESINFHVVNSSEVPITKFGEEKNNNKVIFHQIILLNQILMLLRNTYINVLLRKVVFFFFFESKEMSQNGLWRDPKLTSSQEHNKSSSTMEYLKET